YDDDDDDGGGLSWDSSFERGGKMVRVRASGYGDRVHRVTRSHFGVRRKNPLVVADGGGGGRIIGEGEREK
ncbi:hypothetical protein Tco_0249058, partial [Tanacetum coccineum]